MLRNEEHYPFFVYIEVTFYAKIYKFIYVEASYAGERKNTIINTIYEGT